MFGFEYNSDYESQFLRSNDGKLIIENEYCLNDNNEFVPGVNYKKRKKERRAGREERRVLNGDNKQETAKSNF